jgi:hypothetical protein
MESPDALACYQQVHETLQPLPPAPADELADVTAADAAVDDDDWPLVNLQEDSEDWPAVPRDDCVWEEPSSKRARA